jgi:ribA/ribD-fused uncharacterized protein
VSILEFQGEHRWLSNFWPVTVVLDGIAYPSVECAYQAAKTVILTERKQFTSLTAGQAKRAGKTVTMRKDWNEIKLDVMTHLVEQKFILNDVLRKKLLATGNEELIEGNAWNDTFWGVCKGKGANHLGKIIMGIRTKLQMN